MVESDTAMTPTGGLRWLARAARTLVTHPRLWPTALRQAGVLARPGWWRHRPWLPIPDPDYLHFRMVTTYGEDRAPDPDDLVVYLDWCRTWASRSRR